MAPATLRVSAACSSCRLMAAIGARPDGSGGPGGHRPGSRWGYLRPPLQPAPASRAPNPAPRGASAARSRRAHRAASRTRTDARFELKAVRRPAASIDPRSIAGDRRNLPFLQDAKPPGLGSTRLARRRGPDLRHHRMPDRHWPRRHHSASLRAIRPALQAIPSTESCSPARSTTRSSMPTRCGASTTAPDPGAEVLLYVTGRC